MGSVRVVLQGGPESGSEVSVPADSSGVPTPRFTMPARGSNKPGQLPPLLVYERHKRLPSGMWRFRYVGAEAQSDV